MTATNIIAIAEPFFELIEMKRYNFHIERKRCWILSIAGQSIVILQEKKMIRFSWHSFHSLTTEELYTILTFRSEVFVTEQKIIYTDPDGKDKCALHLFGMEGNDLVAYLRLFPPKSIHAPVTFGRVATAKTVRGKGYGKQLIAEMLGYCKRNFLGNPVECSAQNYLRKFYESFGFEAIGEIYDEEGIPHIAMISYPT